MPLPTLDKTWIYNASAVVNPLYSGGISTHAGRDSLSLLVGLKLAMCKTTGWVDKDGVAATQNFPWTVAATSDGDTAGASDLWTDYTAFYSNVDTPTFRIATNNFGWCVLENAALPNFQFMTGTSSNGTAGIYSFTCVACSWEGFSLGSPVVTAHPTANDRFALVGAIPAGGYITGVNADSQLFDSVIHIAMSTDGECTRIIACRSGVPFIFWQIEKVKSPIAEWGNTIICTARANATTLRNAALTADFAVSAYPAVLLSSGARRVYFTSEGYGTSPLVNVNRTPGHLDNTFKLYPVGLANTLVPPVARLGSMYDMWFTPVSAGQGLNFPASGARQLVSLGGVVIPWTNARFRLHV